MSTADAERIVAEALAHACASRATYGEYSEESRRALLELYGAYHLCSPLGELRLRCEAVLFRRES